MNWPVTFVILIAVLILETGMIWGLVSSSEGIETVIEYVEIEKQVTTNTTSTDTIVEEIYVSYEDLTRIEGCEANLLAANNAINEFNKQVTEAKQLLQQCKDGVGLSNESPKD